MRVKYYCISAIKARRAGKLRYRVESSGQKPGHRVARLSSIWVERKTVEEDIGQGVEGTEEEEEKEVKRKSARGFFALATERSCRQQEGT